MPASAIIYSKIYKTKVILELRDLMAGALEASDYTSSKIISSMAHIYEKAIFKLSSAVSPVSPGMVKTIKNVSESIEIIENYNGYEDMF